MDLSKLMQLFSSPETIESLQLSDKIYASLITTLLGMGITFSALVILLFVISFMHKLTVKPETAKKATVSSEIPQKEGNEDELVAVITAAVVATMRCGRRNIMIRNIKRVNDFQPQWNRTGIHNQINSNLNL